MIKYLGSKRTRAGVLGGLAQGAQARTAVDLFTGSTRVAQEFKHRGLAVTAADLASYSEILARCYIVTDADAVTNGNGSFGGVAAFTDDDFADTQAFRCLHLCDKNAGELDIVIPDAIVYAFIPHGFRGQSPVNTGCIKQDSEGSRVFGPCHIFSGVMHQKKICTLDIYGDFDTTTYFFFNYVFDHFQSVQKCGGAHPCGGPGF